MPGYLVNAAATVSCSHQGTAAPTKPRARVKVDGQPVVLQAPWSVAGCTYPAAAGPPDTTLAFSTGATRVKVEGMPVLLADSMSTAAATGTPGSIIDAGQAKVKGI
jgi:uncharacterized Zn-binding protein involved in type VI secretion